MESWLVPLISCQEISQNQKVKWHLGSFTPFWRFHVTCIYLFDIHQTLYHVQTQITHGRFWREFLCFRLWTHLVKLCNTIIKPTQYRWPYPDLLVTYNFLKGVLHLNLKLACFVCYLKFVTFSWKILKQTVQGTQKLHWNLSSTSNSWVHWSKQHN